MVSTGLLLLIRMLGRRTTSCSIVLTSSCRPTAFGSTDSQLDVLHNKKVLGINLDFFKIICYNRCEPERQSLGLPRGKSGQHREQ